jgi:Flp pilus assembly pilin Flp
MKWCHRVFAFLSNEDGPTAVEYAVLLALLAAMMFASIIYLGQEVNGISETVVDGLDGALNN